MIVLVGPDVGIAVSTECRWSNHSLITTDSAALFAVRRHVLGVPLTLAVEGPVRAISVVIHARDWKSKSKNLFIVCFI